MVSQVKQEEVHSEWDDVYGKNSLRAPFLTWQWHRDWHAVLGKSAMPMCLYINNDIIAPFVRTNDTVTFSGGDEIADYLDIIGPDEQKIKSWPEIIEFFKKNKIRSVTLRNIPENSPTVEYFRRQPGASVEKEDTTPTVTLPASWEEFVEGIADRKYRHELERKIRKFEREHSGGQISESTDPAGDIGAFIDLMKKDDAKKQFLTEDMIQMFEAVAATFTGNISLLFLGMGETRAAGTLAFVSDNTYYLYNSGFDKECCPNAGFYLKSMSIKHAIEKGYTKYNFLQGSERYKYELGGKDFFVYTVHYTLP